MGAIDDPASNAMTKLNGTADRSSRPKSSIFKSFVHRRNNSDGTELTSSFDTQPTSSAAYKPRTDQNDAVLNPYAVSSSADMGMSGFARQGRALGELHYNQQEQPLRSPPKKTDMTSRSPQKNSFVNVSFKALVNKDSTGDGRSVPSSPTKPKKTKSTTNFATLLSRPKSSKNLKGTADDGAANGKDKENRTPEGSASGALLPTPIYAQFATTGAEDKQSDSAGYMVGNSRSTQVNASVTNLSPSKEEKSPLKQRPKSFQPYFHSRADPTRTTDDVTATPKETQNGHKSSTWHKKEKASRPKIASAFSGFGGKSIKGSPSPTPPSPEPVIDPKDIDTHLEAMLDRRNIPENQRYKMRSLSDTIKMEFIRQDWAETQAKKNAEQQAARDNSALLDNAGSTSSGSVGSMEKETMAKGKTSRGRTFTLSKGANKSPSSPTKKKGDGTLGRHFRSKSTESIVSDRPSSGGSSNGGGFFSKVKPQPGPVDFVSYLRKVQKPELVEVGKLHKLRLLLRNETVAWIEDFVRQGGMMEVVGLLNRIMAVEWREEHEDALLHEVLLCLKALSTTALAMQYLHTIQGTLFPALINMIFDPEKKGPSDFTTRNIITSVLFTYIESSSPQERVRRAATVLSYLRDPKGKEEERPVSFVLEMHKERPYRVWCKEAVSVTKEVFWIFLHTLNVVSLPVDKCTKGGQALEPAQKEPARNPNDPSSYLIRHFPQERPPVPAAPYVGGVEWDATNYLASHLELMNAIIACTPTPAERNVLREEFRISGWERCMGGSLRLCKEKFYGAVHDGLRTWVAAAHEDGWDVRDVRYGPPADAPKSPPKKRGGGLTPAAKKKLDEPAPKLQLDLVASPAAEARINSAVGKPQEFWLS
ncbi:hypothetical protein PspLS_04517 [Pyricularia sp. CBS 133598]|nr:hypothetical protein PspLS_04517 [Pyricularia sp. CBS 133598]